MMSHCKCSVSSSLFPSSSFAVSASCSPKTHSFISSGIDVDSSIISSRLSTTMLLVELVTVRSSVLVLHNFPCT